MVSRVELDFERNLANEEIIGRYIEVERCPHINQTDPLIKPSKLRAIMPQTWSRKARDTSYVRNLIMIGVLADQSKLIV